MSKKYTKEYVEEKINNLMDITFIGDYKNTHTKVLTRCNICGYEWNTVPQRLLRGIGCKKCGIERRKGTPLKRKSTEDFINQLSNINSNIEILSEYINAKTPIKCKCKICGNIWDSRPINLLTGYGCSYCANEKSSKKQRKTMEKFIEEMSVINPNIEILSEYNGNSNNVECLCLDCGHKWKATPRNLLRKDGKATGCPKCKKSHGESIIEKWLIENNIYYIGQYKFEDLLGVGGRKLSYDFYLPKYNLLIEYQGEYHDHTASIQTEEDFETQKEHDKRKRDYANEHSLILLEIWYYENIIEKLESIIT